MVIFALSSMLVGMVLLTRSGSRVRLNAPVLLRVGGMLCSFPIAILHKEMTMMLSSKMPA